MMTCDVVAEMQEKKSAHYFFFFERSKYLSEVHVQGELDVGLVDLWNAEDVHVDADINGVTRVGIGSDSRVVILGQFVKYPVQSLKQHSVNQ